ncbi:MAG: hypothetical protein DA408_02390 [Bacteroidetes bacterium]|nr:MAG: hypothetical protein C7N36_02940 [Bacteroidota bacterium]PTM14658.1 MAG: hypothetical protein DA408_02390 [Bacteroidota bacterium]
MKTHYIAFLSLMLLALGLSAQSIAVPPNLNGTAGFPFTYLSDFIDADTSAAGEQLHDTYLLQRGALYFFTGEKTWTFDVNLVATGDEALGQPVVSRANAAGGTALAPMYRGFGSFTWDGIYIIMGEEGADAAAYETAPFRPEGSDKRFIFTNCTIEKSRQGTIRIEGDNTKTYITNCEIRNFGDFERFQGNGRIVDTRDNFTDSVVISNCVMYNIVDRIFIGFRQQGLNYFEYTNNTLFNHIGRHGLIQLKNTRESVIKDNIFMNPSMMGTSPFLANEQIAHVNETNYLFSIDTMVAGASIDMSNNNVFWTDDVLNYYATFDSVTQPMVLSPEFAAMLANPADAYFSEVLELNNVPDRAPLIQYCREAVTYRDSVGITDIMVEDISLANTPFDKGYLFDFNLFDPCYDITSASATAASDGLGLGVRFLCDYSVGTQNVAYNPALNLKSAPNPASDFTQLTYNLNQASHVNLTVFDMNGRTVTTLQNGQLPQGVHTVTWNNFSNVPTGMYFVNLQTEEGRMFIRVVKQ